MTTRHAAVGTAAIVVLDDYFPTRGGGFRIAEFSWMLEHGVVAEVMTTATPLDALVGEYSAVHPRSYRQVRQYDAARLERFECASILFLNNAVFFLDDLERHRLPFVLTLYPGGGLNLGEPDAEAKLSRVLGSPLLRHVITTQPIVTELVRGRARDDLPVTELLGLTVDPTYLSPGPGLRTNYFNTGLSDGPGKPCIDISFVAHRYTADGADKGYPVFLEVIRMLCDAGIEARGHVVGGHHEGELSPLYRDLGLTFYGVLSTHALRSFLLGMDLIVSPTRPGQLAMGSFDGFPTGACVEAALCGVGVLASDVLEQNRLFTDRRDIHIPEPSAAAFVARIMDVLAEPDGLRRLGQSGLRTTRHAYSVDTQLWGRRAVLESGLESARQAIGKYASVGVERPVLSSVS